MAALARDIGSPRSVPAIDKVLEEMKLEWLDVLGLREIAARRHGVSTPPPVLPSIEAETSDVAAPEVKRKNPRQPPPGEPIQTLNLIAGSAADIVWGIVEPKPMGVSYPELREEFAKSPQGRNVRGHERPYYAAVQRLKGGGHVQIYKSRLWATHHLRKFQADVAAGLVEDIEDKPRFHSKWTDAILDHLRQRKGEWVDTKEVAKHISGLPEFADCKDYFTPTADTLRNLKYRYAAVERKSNGSKGSVWRAVSGYVRPGTNGDIDGEESKKDRPAEADLHSAGRVH
jgi:hypothetical protein